MIAQFDQTIEDGFALRTLTPATKQGTCGGESLWPGQR
jgi:hypothetical protein